MFETILTEEFTDNYIKKKLVDKYAGTLFEGYCYLTNGSKGEFGESFTANLLVHYGHKVEKRINSGHDRLVDGIKTEIKFSLADFNKPFSCILNHVSKDKDWERLIYTIVNKNQEDFKMIWFTKSSFLEILEEGSIFRNQQGGQQIANDDFMVPGQKSILKLINHPLVKDIKEWREYAT